MSDERKLRVVPRADDVPFSDFIPPEHDDAEKLERGDHVELGHLLLSRLTDTAPTVHSSGRWWQYSGGGGIWGSLTQSDLDKITINYAGSRVVIEKKPLKLKASDVNGARKIAETLAEKEDHFDNALPGVAFTNGFAIVGPNGVRLAGHCEAHRARFSYPFEFQARDTCRFSEFLHSCFDGDDDAEDKVRIIREHVGLCIIGRATEFQTALVMVGDGSNGKGVCMSSIEACMPVGSVAAVPPQKMGGEYYRARLVAKLLNSVSELPEAEVIDSDTFKAIISGDTIEARNPAEKPFSYRPIAGHIYACNRLPGTTDQSKGFWRRFVVLRFGREFPVNSGFSESIVRDVAATVGWAVSGVSEAIARKCLIIPASSDELKRAWRSSSDQVAVFFEETLEPSNEWTQANTLYQSYRTWANDNGHRPMASNKFSERMRMLGYPSEKKKSSNVYYVRTVKKDNRAWTWDGEQ